MGITKRKLLEPYVERLDNELLDDNELFKTFEINENSKIEQFVKGLSEIQTELSKLNQDTKGCFEFYTKELTKHINIVKDNARLI